MQVSNDRKHFVICSYSGMISIPSRDIVGVRSYLINLMEKVDLRISVKECIIWISYSMVIRVNILQHSTGYVGVDLQTNNQYGPIGVCL